MEEMKDLLVKYVTGSAGVDEIARVEVWLDADPANMEEYVSLERAWRDARLAGDAALLDADRAFDRLKGRLDMAAESSRVVVMNESSVRRVKWIYKAAVAAGIIVIAGGAWLYWGAGKKAEKEEAPVAFVVPRGEKKHVVLPDSTELWLNAGSTLRVEPGFGVTGRVVYLDGEGFFKVKHDSKMVFTVMTRNYTIRDIGTAFNINTYSGDSRFEAAVLEGEISVEGHFSKNNSSSRIVLSHHQVLKIKKEPVETPKARAEPIVSLTQSATVDRYAGWKEDQLSFDDERFRDIANQLERRYNVTIVIDDAALADYHFSGNFQGLPDVAAVLDILKETTPFTYDIKNDTVVMKIRH